MVVFSRIVRPFVDSLCGRTITGARNLRIPARLTRNIPSALGRIDYVRVRLVEKEGALWAEPVLGKSALINTMVRADGLVEIDMNTEGLDKGAGVSVITMI
jgi:molybdopterin molybdotransferase